jgi:hypothetical protein
MTSATPGSQIYVVDRIEGDRERLAILVPDAGRAIEVALAELPRGCAEGDVIRVPVRGGHPVWEGAVRDATERDRRLAGAGEVLRKLRGRDPGGDVVL